MCGKRVVRTNQPIEHMFTHGDDEIVLCTRFGQVCRISPGQPPRWSRIDNGSMGWLAACAPNGDVVSAHLDFSVCRTTVAGETSSTSAPHIMGSVALVATDRSVFYVDAWGFTRRNGEMMCPRTRCGCSSIVQYRGSVAIASEDGVFVASDEGPMVPIAPSGGDVALVVSTGGRLCSVIRPDPRVTYFVLGFVGGRLIAGDIPWRSSHRVRAYRNYIVGTGRNTNWSVHMGTGRVTSFNAVYNAHNRIRVVSGRSGIARVVSDLYGVHVL